VWQSGVPTPTQAILATPGAESWTEIVGSLTRSASAALDKATDESRRQHREREVKILAICFLREEVPFA